MSKYRFGKRIGKEGTLRVGASALIYDKARERILMTQREDNSRWCLPGGGMEPGESAAETCVREVAEETGLEVEVTRLVGIYTSPHMIIEYSDGNKIQPGTFSFEVEISQFNRFVCIDPWYHQHFVVAAPRVHRLSSSSVF